MNDSQDDPYLPDREDSSIRSSEKDYVIGAVPITMDQLGQPNVGQPIKALSPFSPTTGSIRDSSDEEEDDDDDYGENRSAVSVPLTRTSAPPSATPSPSGVLYQPMGAHEIQGSYRKGPLENERDEPQALLTGGARTSNDYGVNAPQNEYQLYSQQYVSQYPSTGRNEYGTSSDMIPGRQKTESMLGDEQQKEGTSPTIASSLVSTPPPLSSTAEEIQPITIECERTHVKPIALINKFGKLNYTKDTPSRNIEVVSSSNLIPRGTAVKNNIARLKRARKRRKVDKMKKYDIHGRRKPAPLARLSVTGNTRSLMSRSVHHLEDAGDESDDEQRFLTLRIRDRENMHRQNTAVWLKFRNQRANEKKAKKDKRGQARKNNSWSFIQRISYSYTL